MTLNWTIYYDHEYPKGGKTTTCVLLIDGAWTDENNCNRREQYGPDHDPIIMHKPKLFATRGGARNHKLLQLGDRKCYRVAKYAGPTDPNARMQLTLQGR